MVTARTLGLGVSTPIWEGGVRSVRDLVQAGQLRFSSLVDSLRGIHPADVVRIIEQGRDGGAIPPSFASKILYDASLAPPPPSHHPNLAMDWLPLPHILDYDWRFTNPSADQLAMCARLVAGSHGRIACLGTPSVFLSLLKEGLRNRCSLYDRSQTIVNSLQTVDPACSSYRANLRDSVELERGAAAIVSDPPWYPEEMLGFLLAATRIAGRSSTLFMTVLPETTRPGAASDVQALRSRASDLGWQVGHVEKSKLRYHTPFFEWNTLRSLGISNVRIDWRPANLMVLHRQKRFEERASALKVEKVHREPDWIEAKVGRMRVKLRRRLESPSVDPTLEGIVPGDVVPTVSRRARIRERVDVWTSGNRVFRCQDTASLAIVVSSIHARRDPVTRIQGESRTRLTSKECSDIRRTAVRVRELRKLEAQEFHDYLRWTRARSGIYSR